MGNDRTGRHKHERNNKMKLENIDGVISELDGIQGYLEDMIDDAYDIHDIADALMDYAVNSNPKNHMVDFDKIRDMESEIDDKLYELHDLVHVLSNALEDEKQEEQAK